MEHTQNFDVNSPISDVWAFVCNSTALLECIPGCEQVEEQDEQTLSAVVKDRVGPFRVQFNIVGHVERDEADHALKATASGKDTKLGSTMNLNLEMRLAETEPGQTHVDIYVDLSILGKIATLGFSVMKNKATQTLKGFGENFERAVGGGAADASL